MITEGEGSVQLASLYYLVQISCFKRCYLNEEVNCTEPSTSVTIPWP